MTSVFGLPAASRDGCRSFPPLIEWLDDNWFEARRCMDAVCLLDGDMRVISHGREVRDRARGLG